MLAKCRQDHVLASGSDQLAYGPGVYEVIAVDHQKVLIHMRLGLAQGMGRSQQLVLLDIADLDAKIDPILEVVHDPLFLVAHHHVKILDAVLRQRLMTCSMKGRLPTGSMTLDLVWVSGLHLRPSPAANMTAFKSITASKTQSDICGHELALYLFGPWLIKYMKKAHRKNPKLL